MRPIDEVLWSYANQRPAGQRFQLRTLEGLPPEPDGDQVLRLVQGAARGAHRAYAAQVELRVHGQLFGDRLSRPRLPNEPPPLPVSALAPEERAALLPLVECIRSGLAEGGARAPAGLRVLSQVPVPAALEAIRSLAAREELRPEVLAALAAHGGEEAGALAMELLPEGVPGADEAGCLVALRGFPGPGALAALEVFSTGGADLAPAVAWALEGFRGPEADALLEQLMAREETWSRIHAIVSLVRRGGETVPPILETVYHTSRGALPKVVSLQEAGRAGLDCVVPLARAGLGDPDDFVRAAALEALLEVDAPPEEYADKVGELLEHDQPRLARFAALACARVDPQRAMRRVEALLSSGSADDVLQGVQCLAHFRNPTATRILATIVEQVPEGPLGIQAVRSLGMRASGDPEAVKRLAEVLPAANPAMRQVAAWFLADAHPVSRQQAAEALARALRFEEEDPTATVYSTALGLLGESATEALPVLAARLDAGGAAARAAARALATAFPSSDEAGALAAREEPVLRVYGDLRTWISGGSSLAVLGELTKGDEAGYLAAAEVAREIAWLVRYRPVIPRLAPGGAVAPEWKTATPLEETPLVEPDPLTESSVMKAEEAAKALAGLRTELAAGVEGALQRAGALGEEALEGAIEGGAGRTIFAVLATVVLLASAWSVFEAGPDPVRSVSRAPPRVMPDDERILARWERDRQRVLTVADEVVADETTKQTFPARWNTLRAWLAHPRTAADPKPVASFPQLMELRKRFVADDPLAEPRLDEWLTAEAAGIRAREQAVEEEAASLPDPPGSPPGTPTR